MSLLKDVVLFIKKSISNLIVQGLSFDVKTYRHVIHKHF